MSIAWECNCACFFLFFCLSLFLYRIGVQWVRVLEAWSSEGDCDKDIFLTANTACGVTQTWHPDLVARLICASARGGIVSRNLLMDLQQHGWGQKVISEMQFNLLVPFLMAYAEMTIHAHVMMDMVYKRLSDNYFAPNRRESPAILSAVKAAWCFALLGYRGDAFLRSALYSAGTGKLLLKLPAVVHLMCEWKT